MTPDHTHAEVSVTIHRGTPNERTFTFTNSFTIGQARSCDVQILDPVVSGHHLHVVREKKLRTPAHLHATLPGQRLMNTRIRALPSATQICQRYLCDALPGNVGQDTLQLGHATQQAMKKRTRRFLLLFVVASIVATTAVVIAWQQRRQWLPRNPRQRNFWELVKRFKIPRQTYDFVFYVISAAVIGENPALFGFDLENPLAEVS